MFRTLRATVLSACLVAAFGLTAGGYAHLGSGSATQAYADTTCQLSGPGGSIQHVIYIQFDNVHLERDNPNVPSDLEQMPNLLNFIKNNGVMLSNNHTPLIAHTATDILTSLTGLYGDRMGVPISNSFRYFNPNGSNNLGVSFAYWTDPIYDPTTSNPSDTTYNMVTPTGKNTPAPWVPFTRAGCNFGSFSMANTGLENIGTDIPTVFGANSPEAAEVKSNPDQATADFTGAVVHCAQGSSVCSSGNGGRPDVLPDEPYGYSGYSALFGNKAIAPVISPGGPVTDLNGQVIKDPSTGDIGFPGFDPTAAQSLGYVAAMQEHGVPVTYAYISDAHDNHSGENAFGPGEAGYEAQLKAWNDAFGKFFARMASDGITPANTLYVITTDEQDHFAGGGPTPANCDGVTTPCTYTHLGELSTNVKGMLVQAGTKTGFGIHADTAPNFYLAGNPNPFDPATRAFERSVGSLTGTNLISGQTENLTKYLADPQEMQILHMTTSDLSRTPTLTMFAKPDYYLFSGGSTCKPACITEDPGHAWNHGALSPDINTTWLGLVGPGVRKSGTDTTTWADETDIRPTMMYLLGLRDDYQHDGRVLIEDLTPAALGSASSEYDTLVKLGQVYKQINASVGQLGLDTLKVDTAGIMSNSPQDAYYQQTVAMLRSLETDRDALVSQIRAVLESSEFHNWGLDQGQATSLTNQAQALLNRADAMAAGVPSQQ